MHTLSGSHGVSTTMVVIVVVDDVIVVMVVVVEVVVSGRPLTHFTKPSSHSVVPFTYPVQTSSVGR